MSGVEAWRTTPCYSSGISSLHWAIPTLQLQSAVAPFIVVSWKDDGYLESNVCINQYMETVMLTHTHTHVRIWLRCHLSVMCGAICPSIDRDRELNRSLYTIRNTSNTFLPKHSEPFPVPLWASPAHPSLPLSPLTSYHLTVAVACGFVGVHHAGHHLQKKRPEGVQSVPHTLERLLDVAHPGVHQHRIFQGHLREVKKRGNEVNKWIFGLSLSSFSSSSSSSVTFLVLFCFSSSILCVWFGCVV